MTTEGCTIPPPSPKLRTHRINSIIKDKQFTDMAEQ
jgi:hypothetical protein